MRLYIMRHGEAVQAGPDGIRPLTAKGRSDAVKIAQFLQASKCPLSAIWHSTKARAIETASYVEKTYGEKIPLETRTDLNPDDSVENFFAQLADEAPDNLLIVGHLPFVESLVSFLITGGESNPVAFHTATIVALEGTFENGFIILFAVPADCLP
jgi:phosphohistidine phosphatase